MKWVCKLGNQWAEAGRPCSGSGSQSMAPEGVPFPTPHLYACPAMRTTYCGPRREQT